MSPEAKQARRLKSPTSMQVVATQKANASQGCSRPTPVKRRMGPAHLVHNRQASAMRITEAARALPWALATWEMR